METSRVIKVVSNGTGPGTHVYNADGTELGNITEMTIHFKAGEPATAEIKAYEIQGEFQAEVAKIERLVVPPAKLTESMQLMISEPTRHWGRYRSRYVLTRFIPLPTWGTRTIVLAKGWMSPIGPMTIERMTK